MPLVINSLGADTHTNAYYLTKYDRLLSKDGTSLQYKGHAYKKQKIKTKPMVCPPDKI